MSAHPGKLQTEHPAELYHGVYSQPYHAIVQPGRVWTVGKYFLRRWCAYLTPPEIWLVIGARQLSYLNRRRPWFEAYDSTLADAAGLNVDVYRRTIKRAIAAQEGAIACFLSKAADPAYIVRDDVPRKGRTRYAIRLDDPLTPADARALAQWLQERLAPDAGVHEVTAVLQEARRLDPVRRWAGDLGPEAWQPDDSPLFVEDVLLQNWPHLDEQNEPGSAWRAAAGALHAHLVTSEVLHLEPHYFREQWLPALGPGPALLILMLRSLCYYNEESGEIRDVVRTEANELAQQLQTTTRTLRRWFKKVERAAAHDRLFGPFFAFLESNKQADQKVIATYRVNLKMPLTPTDLARYQVTSAAGDRRPLPPHSANGLPDKKSATQRRVRQKVPDKSSVTASTAGVVTDKKSVTIRKVADKRSATRAAHGQIVGNGTPGDGQKVGASQTNRRPFKYYERLLAVLNVQEILELEQRTEQQHQHLWRLHEEEAQLPFAVVVAGDDGLPGMLDLLGIHEPARSRILEQKTTLPDLLAWHLYAQRQSNLEQPLGYVVSRAVAGDKPPQPFTDLAALSWEQWRTYAALAWLEPAQAADPQLGAQWPCFAAWLELYGAVPPRRLPFDVGQGLETLRIVLDPEMDRVSPSVASASTQSPPAPSADQKLWREALDELARQMTQSTFDAWLRSARLQQREGRTWTIAVATPAACSWLENRLRPVIERTLSSIAGEVVAVHFVVNDD